MFFDRLQVAALVDALGLDGTTPAKRPLLAGLSQSAQAGLGIGHQHTQHAVQIAIVEGISGALQVVVVREELLSPGDVSSRPFQFDGVRAQIDSDIQAVFQHVQVLVARAEQGFYVRADLNIFLH